MSHLQEKINEIIDHVVEVATDEEERLPLWALTIVHSFEEFADDLQRCSESTNSISFEKEIWTTWVMLDDLDDIFDMVRNVGHNYC